MPEEAYLLGHASRLPSWQVRRWRRHYREFINDWRAS